MDSKSIKFSDLKNYANGGVVIHEKLFYKIYSINDNQFYAKFGRDSFRGLTKFLHPYGKDGTIKQFDGIKPFFIYKKDNIRKDIPKLMRDGTPFDEINTDTIQGLRKANLTNHIIQDTNSKEGGYVIQDLGDDVIVRMRNGGEKYFSKSNLFKVRITYTKKYHKRIWFRYEPNKSPRYDDNLGNEKIPIDAYSDYIELAKQLDGNYMYADFKTFLVNSAIDKEMTRLIQYLTPTQKIKLKIKEQ